MVKSEIRMTMNYEKAMTKRTKGYRLRHSDLPFDSSFGLRHSDFFARNEGQKVESQGLTR